MAVERLPASGTIIDVLDRVLDKGIVIDAYVRVSLIGVDLVSVEARVVVASMITYLRFADQISATPTASRPQVRAVRQPIEAVLAAADDAAPPQPQGV